MPRLGLLHPGCCVMCEEITPPFPATDFNASMLILPPFPTGVISSYFGKGGKISIEVIAVSRVEWIGSPTPSLDLCSEAIGLRRRLHRYHRKPRR